MHKITVTKPYLPPKKEFEKYIDEIWENQWLTNKGPLHDKFVNKLQNYLGVPNVNITVNGHLALDIAIKTMGLKGEVITTPFTFASTTHALVMNNITPVFCDIKENDLTMDPTKIEKLITPHTSAIMPVHVYGHPCDFNEIDKIAKKYNLKVLYDAAHSFGVKYKNESLCNFGDISMLSFHATKLFHSIEGGALIYHNNDYTKLINAYKNFGIEDEETVSYVGGNAKMNEFQAAMGLVNLDYIDPNIRERKEITNLYRKLLDQVKGIHYFTPDQDKNITYNYAYFPIKVKEDFIITRDELYIKLKDKGIFTRKYFWPIITEFECYKEQFGNYNLDVAKKASAQILCLPIYNGLSSQEVEYICHIIYELSNKK